MSAILRLRTRLDDPAYGFVGFLLRMLAYLLVSTALVRQIPLEAYRPLREATARFVHAILWIFTDRVSQQRDIVTFDGFAVQIVSECFGLLEMAIFGATVLAYGTTWRKRLLGLALGMPAIYAFNLARILMLLLVGRYSPALFEFAHIYFWQATLILVITSLWLLWIRFVVRDETSSVVRA